ncbi:MAG TPA: nitrate- and nitrite sensing domain-containing protein [Pseudonocardiaceae bacterium]|nr:nitrate- and nitrite sensing domain-containing protein [Pseudonocardiaceae bacterium]
MVARPDIRAIARPANSATLRRGVLAIIRPESIRAKLVRILVVSLALALVFLSFLIAQETKVYSAAHETTKVVTVALSVQDAVHELQRERGLTNGLLDGGLQYLSQIKPQRARVDASLAALKKTINDATTADADQVRTALGKLDGLGTLRNEVDNNLAEPQPTFQFYTDAITALNGLDLGVGQAQDDQLRYGLLALYALGNAKEYAGQEQGLLNGVFSSGAFTVDNYTDFAQVLGQRQSGLTTYDSFATPAQRGELDSVLRSRASTEAVGFEGTAIAGVNGTLPSRVDPVAWWNSMTAVIDDMRGVQQSVGQDIVARANTLQDSALAWLIGIGVLAALTVAAMVTLVVGAARSVIGPLGLLAREADDVSSQRLPGAVAIVQAADTEVPRPAPVATPQRAASEIKLVARALDRVQDTALGLASEQAMIRRNTAVSLANLGRRNQNLLRRQLSLISEFEREELDPTALAKLFQLDHLATRMRRNAESLLVLVGETSPRPWSPPMPAVDVIRAALSEVEDYRRVVVRRADDAWINGAASSEVAHMLAELVENGLAFSPPDLQVEIYGRKAGDRYLLVVVDRGIGMVPAELAKARARLRDEENFVVAPTRFLGHYVVGRLARQLSVHVDLSDSPVAGTTAQMVLPADLLTEPPSETVSGGSAVRRDPQPAAVQTSAPAAPRRRPTESDAAEPPVAARPRAHPLGYEKASTPTPERTRNGLVKRKPLAGGPVRPAAPARTAPVRATPASPPGQRSPVEVGTMLSSFRRGHQRGESVGGEALGQRRDHES